MYFSLFSLCIMRNIFKNADLEAQFNRNGYVIVPFLPKNLVEELKKAYFDTLAQRGGSMLSEETDFDFKEEITYDFTFIDRNPDYKRLVFNMITTRFEPFANAILDNYKPIIANFIRKEENAGEVPLHQNWAFIDETKGTSVSIWCPLVDSNETNGTLQIVPGSHKRFGQIRGPLIPWELEPIKHEIIARYLTPMNVTAGQAVILDDSVVHYSNINHTNGLRLAIQLIMIPAELPCIHYHMDIGSQKQNNVEVLEVSPEFYMEFHPWLKPKGVKKIGELPYKKQKFTEKMFAQKLHGTRFDERLSLWGKLSNIFS